MLSKLIILSDLFGFKNSTYQNYYCNLFSKNYNITLYDCCELAGIDSNEPEEKIHTQFLEFGIDKVVQKIISREKEKVSIIGFSVGGTIAWKAGLLGLHIDKLFCISSTRLRYETKIPTCNQIELLFADNDNFAPNKAWFTTMKIYPVFLKNEDHTCYKKREVAQLLYKKITQ